MNSRCAIVMDFDELQLILSSLSAPATPADNQNLIQNGLSIDPRYSAVYGNPYLRQPNNALPPLPPPSTANPSATPAPPPYNSVTRQHQHNHLGMSPVTANLLTKSSSSNLSNSNLAISSNSNNNTLTSNHSNSNMTTNLSSLNVNNQLSMGSPSSGSNSTTTSSGQFILPSNGTFKKTGSLATHV